MAKREREAADMGAMVGRVLKSLARRADAGDMDALVELEWAGRAVEELSREAVDGLRAEPWNYSWTDIGNALGVSRQAAQQRFGVSTPEATNPR